MYTYSWGPMFVDCQKFAGSLGCCFVGIWFVALQYKTIIYFIKHLWGRNLMGKSNPRNYQALFRHKQ